MRRLMIGIVLVFVVAFPAFASNDPGYSRQWGIQKIGAPQAWPASTGSEITVAIVDSGIDLQHPDLKDNLTGGYDVLENDDPDDENGHGTHVAGIAGAVTENGIGVAGVAPKARLMPVRVLDEVGTNLNPTNPQEVLANTDTGVRWAADHGARVINMSFGSVGGQGPDEGTASAIAYAWSKGAIPVIAAGNDDGENSGFTDQPAVIVVATDRDDSRAGYSNIAGSAKWGLSAPGSGVYSTDCCTLDLLDGSGDGYGTHSGTSMAAPHVSGALALLLARGLAPTQAIERLIATAVDLGPGGRDDEFGHGRIDLAKAVQGLGASTSNLAGGSSRSTGARGESSEGGAQPSGSPTPGEASSTTSTSQDRAARENEERRATQAQDSGGLNWFLIVPALALLGVGFFFLTKYLLEKVAK